MNALVDAINNAWARLYGGEPVTDTGALVNRINQIAADRDCWVANAKANQVEYLKLEALLKKSKTE